MPVQYGDCGSVVRVGARSGSPASARLPLAAVTSRSDAGAPASGPVDPYGVTVTTTSEGFHDAAVARSTSSRDCTRTSARTSRSRKPSRSRGRSSMTPRLFAFSEIQSRPRSGPGRSARKGGTVRTGSPVGGSTFTTSPPRSARMRAPCAAAEAPQTSAPASSTTRRPSSSALIGLTPRARQDLRPGLRLHERLAHRDLVLTEPLVLLDLVDRLHRPHAVVLVPERHGRVDRHAALEARVHRGPLRAARGEALRRDEGLARASGHWVEDVVARVHARGERPDD